MAFNPEPAFDALKTLLAGSQGIQTVYEGTPLAGDRRVIGWIAYLPGPSGHFSGPNQIKADELFFLCPGYAVRDAPATAERGLMLASVSLKNRFYDNKYNTVDAVTRLLNGSVSDMVMEPAESREPLYIRLNEEEYRVAPHVVRATLFSTF